MRATAPSPPTGSCCRRSAARTLQGSARGRCPRNPAHECAHREKWCARSPLPAGRMLTAAPQALLLRAPRATARDQDVDGGTTPGECGYLDGHLEIQCGVPARPAAHLPLSPVVRHTGLVIKRWLLAMVGTPRRIALTVFYLVGTSAFSMLVRQLFDGDGFTWEQFVMGLSWALLMSPLLHPVLVGQVRVAPKGRDDRSDRSADLK